MGTRQARRAPSQEPPLNSRTVCPQRIVEKWVVVANSQHTHLMQFSVSGVGYLVTRMDTGPYPLTYTTTYIIYIGIGRYRGVGKLPAAKIPFLALPRTFPLSHIQ